MEKSLFFVTYIHKDRIQRRHYLFNTPVVDITDRIVVGISAFTTNLLETVVFGKRDSNLLWLYIHNQFAFHNLTSINKKCFAATHLRPNESYATKQVRTNRLTYAYDDSYANAFYACE